MLPDGRGPEFSPDPDKHGERALLGFVTVPGNHRCWHRQNEVVIACAEVVNLEPSDRVRSPPHDDADLSASGRKACRIG